MPIVKKLRRICCKCGKLFVPQGKYHKMCNNCQKKPGKWLNGLVVTKK